MKELNFEQMESLEGEFCFLAIPYWFIMTGTPAGSGLPGANAIVRYCWNS